MKNCIIPLKKPNAFKGGYPFKGIGRNPTVRVIQFPRLITLGAQGGKNPKGTIPRE